MCPIRPICVLSFLAGLLAASLPSAGPGVPPPAPAASAVNSPQLAAPLDVAAEAEKLRQALAAEVTHLIVDGPRGKEEWIVRARAEIAASGLAINRPPAGGRRRPQPAGAADAPVFGPPGGGVG